MTRFALSTSRRALAALALCTSALLCAPVAAADLLVPHAQGTTVLASTPTRVAVFDLGALDVLQALGVDVAAVPGANFPAGLEAFAHERHAKVGTLFEPAMDALRTLAPDLIIVGGRSAKHYEALSAIAPTLDLGAGFEAYANAIVTNTLTLGRVFDRNAQAAALVTKLLETRAKLDARLGDADALTLFVVGGRANANAPGERFGIVHDLALLPSVLPAAIAEEGAEGARPEAVLAADPDVAGSRAWREGRVIRLDPPTWYLAPGGITAAQALLDDMLQRLDTR